VNQVAGDDGDEQAEDERRVGRTAEQVDARQQVVHRREGRRIPAKRIEQHEAERRREEADLAAPHQAARQPAGNQDHGENAAIDLADVLRQEQPGRRHPLAPARTGRPPEHHVGVGGAEQIRDDEHEEEHGVQRAASGRFQADDGTVAGSGQQRGEHHRDHGDGGGRHGACRERKQRAADAREPPAAVEPPRDDVKGEHVKPDQRHLIASDDEERDHGAGRKAEAPGRAVQRARHEPQRDRHIRQADDLAGVLQARRRRAAEREDQRRDHRAAGMPAAVAEEQHQAGAAGKQIGEGDGVDGAEARGRVEPRQGEMQRREDQRLRIGDLRPAGEDVRRPERLLAARQRRREELQFGLKLRLGVPRDRDGAGQPRPRQQGEGGGVEEQRHCKGARLQSG
jgi:hypothetical protein